MFSKYEDLFKHNGVPVDNSANMRPKNFSPKRHALEISKHIYLQSNDYLLDVGCGNGLTAMEISKHVGKIALVDSNPNLVSFLKKKKIPKVGRIECTKCFNLRVFSDNTFDKIICCGVLAYCSQDEIIETIRECYRVAKKGAYLYFGDIFKISAKIPESYGHTKFDWKKIASDYKLKVRKSFFEPDKRYDLIIKK